MRALILSLLLTFVTGCFSQKTPVSTLKEYIEKRFNTSISRIEIKTYLTDRLLENVDKLSEEEFKKFSELNNHRFIDIEILSEECSEERCALTYNLSYRKSHKDTGDLLSKVKKIALMKKEGDSWKISDIENLKTTLDFKDPLEIN